MKPPITGTLPVWSRGKTFTWSARSMAASSGMALPKWLFVRITSRASTCAAGIPRWANAAAIITLESRSPVAHNEIRRSRGEFAENGNTADQLVERVERPADVLRQCVQRGAGDELSGGLKMSRPQAGSDLQRGLAVAPAVRCGGGAGQQLVRHLAHRRDNHDRLQTLRQTPRHNAGRAG